MADNDVVGLHALVCRISSDQRARWAAGDRVLVEDLLHENADAGLTQDALLDLIYGEVLLREDFEEAVSLEEYLGRFPEFQEQLTRQFQVHLALADDETAHGALGQAEKPTANLADLPTGLTGPGPGSELPVISGFEILSIAGRGGAGVVCRAMDQQLNRVVAIKLLSGQGMAGTGSHEQLLREAKAGASLRHSGIVRVYQIGAVEGAPFLVMEFMTGGSLAQRLRSGPLPADEAVSLVHSVATAIQYAHEQGVIHRDLKPGNILLDGAGRPHISDFGLARQVAAEQSVHATGDVIGTPAYMPPEQAHGQRATERSDVYAIGAVLYESLCGRPPFQAASAWEVVSQVMTDDPPLLRRLNSSLSRDLETICARCLEKDPARRYATAGEVAEELDRYRQGLPLHARPVGFVEQVARWCRRNVRTALLAGTSLLLLFGLAVGSTLSVIWLMAANDAISTEQNRTRAAEQQAVVDRGAAIDSLSRLVDSLFEDLSADAATIRTRESVVAAAIEGLTSVTRIRGDARADLAAMRAYRRLGDLFVLRGASAKAADSYRTAIQIGETLVAADPESLTARADLAAAIGDLADDLVRENKFDDVEQHNAAVKATAELILRSRPDDTAAWRLLVDTHIRELHCLSASAEHQQIIDRAAGISADVNRLLTLTDADFRASLAAERFEFVTGRAYFDSRKLAAAREHFALARSHLDRARLLQPRNHALAEPTAVLTRATGLADWGVSDHESAVAAFEEALLGFEALAASDPENAAFRQQLANTHVLIANPLYALGRHETAIAHQDEACRIYQNLLKESPANDMLRVLLAESHNAAANNLLALNRWSEARKHYREMIQCLAGGERQEPASGAAAVWYLGFARLLDEALSRLLGDVPATATADGGCLALLLAARREAIVAPDETLSESTLHAIRSADSEVTAATFESLFAYIRNLKGLSPTVEIYRQQFEARVCALRAARLADAEPDGAARTQLTSRAVTVLKEVETAAPGGVQELIFNEPDLATLRQGPEFAASGIRLPGQ